MKILIQAAIDEVRRAFPLQSVDVDQDADGGAYVRVADLEFARQYAPSTGWIAFHIAATYPHADIYGHYVPPDLKRVDGNELGKGFHSVRDMALGKFQGKAVFISRKAKRWDPSQDTAALNLRMILDWMGSR